MKEESAVAAVYDRRTENETGAHRDAANVSSFYKKIAVADFLKIFRINPAVIDSRYRTNCSGIQFLVDAD